MEEMDIKDILESLAKSQDRSQTARIRDIFDHIEYAIKSGATRLKILEALNKNGFCLSEKGFETILYRLRKEKKEEEKVKPTVKSTQENNRTYLTSSENDKLVKPTDFDPKDLI